VQDEPPRWPNESDDSIGLESMSDPEDSFDMPAEDDEDELDDGFEASDEKEPPRRRYARSDRRSGSASVSSHVSNVSSRKSDTEEDPVDPITPGPGSRFDISPHPSARNRMNEKGPRLVVEEDSLLDNDDDWIEAPHSPQRSSASPSPSPSPPPAIPPSPPTTVSEPSGSVGSRREMKTSGASAASVSGSTMTITPGVKKRSKRQVPVPVPAVRIPEQEHYAFPVIQRNADEGSREGSAERRMHNARARDGGRTQSGGVRGILTEDN
jgi:cysteine protease ATG4